MHARLLRSVSYATTLIFCFVQVAYPQTSSSPPISASASAGGQDASSGQATPVFKREQLDQMLAPIALYPDDLLALVFMGATYPTEVVQADRWIKKPENSKLKGDQLEAALDKQTWDPSVKSLTQFPQVLETMSDNLDWTQKLGDAMLAQQQDVMESVQRLRKSAEGAGTLQTTPQQTVTNQGDTIIIQPSDPQTVYVPAYNPQTAYGEWPYPSYPPPYYPPPPAYYPSYPAYPLGGALAAGLAFGVGVGIVGGMWGWGNCNWGGGSVNINRNTYNNINRSNIAAGRATQLPAGGANWRHDPGHRGGVAYRDRGSQQNFQRASTRPADARQNFSGRSGVGNAGLGANRSGGSIGANRPSTRPAGGANRAAAGGGANRASARPAAAANRASARPSTGAARQSPGAGIGGRSAAATRPTPSAFSGMSNGRAANAQAARGAASRGSMSASRGNAGARAGGAGGAARSGGGGRAGGGGGGRGGGRR